MFTPGMGRGTLKPTAPMTRVLAAVPLAESVRAAPSCRFTLTGSRVPPISRKSASPPSDVNDSAAPLGFQVDTPAVSVTVPSPTATRPPQASPSPKAALGREYSPLIVKPVPPLGLFQTGCPSHCAAAEVARSPRKVTVNTARIHAPSRLVEVGKTVKVSGGCRGRSFHRSPQPASVHPHAGDRHARQRAVAQPAGDPRVEHGRKPEVGTEAEAELHPRRAAFTGDEREGGLHIGNDLDRGPLRLDPAAQRQADRNE